MINERKARDVVSRVLDTPEGLLRNLRALCEHAIDDLNSNGKIVLSTNDARKITEYYNNTEKELLQYFERELKPDAFESAKDTLNDRSYGNEAGKSYPLPGVLIELLEQIDSWLTIDMVRNGKFVVLIE